MRLYQRKKYVAGNDSKRATISTVVALLLPWGQNYSGMPRRARLTFSSKEHPVLAVQLKALLASNYAVSHMQERVE
jgi:hypothetical protein